MSDVTMADHAFDAPDEERAYPRYEGRLEASLLVEGRAWRCWVRDISLGGAGLEPAIPAAVGKDVMLSSPFFDFDARLPGRVINVAQDKTCLAFDLEPEMREQLTRFLTDNTTS